MQDDLIQDVYTHLVIALLQRLLRQPLPALRSINRLRGFHRHVQVTALNRQLESRIRVLDKVQSNLE